MHFINHPRYSGDEDHKRDERSNAPYELPEVWELIRLVQPLAWDLTSSSSSNISNGNQSAAFSSLLDKEIFNSSRTALRVAEDAVLNGKTGKLNIA
uniref:Uncharacterized protein n=1 Tax=Plectus sambesii TaxID=2011161 RepID=A0A914VM63_9BILA